MDEFFPENFLDGFFWDDPPPVNESTPVPDIELSARLELEQESLDLELPTSQNSIVEESLPPSNQSAFIQYKDMPRIGFGHESSQNVSNSQNLTKGSIGLLRRSYTAETRMFTEHKRERRFRHMMNQRMRRQRQRQCCIALHSILPVGTKTDNDSVILAAAREIQRFQGCKEELQRENSKLEGNLRALEKKKRVGGTKIQFKIPSSASVIDSVLVILRFLKKFGVNTQSINTNFSSEELSAVLETETETESVFVIERLQMGKVEMAIEKTLNEV